MKKKSPENTPAARKLDSKALKAEVARLMIRSPKKLYSARQIIKRLNINNTKDSVEQALVVLKEEGLLEKLNDGRYVLKDKNAQTRKKTLKTYEGIVDMTRTGAGYIKCPDLKEDVYIPAKFLHGAMNRDKVSFEVFHMSNRRKPEGQVLEVIKRATEHFIGTVYINQRRIIVAPDGLYNDFDIFIDNPPEMPVSAGDKVIVKITVWPGPRRINPVGKITEVLGKAGNSDIEMKTILINQGFELEFPQEVLDELKGISTEIHPKEIAQRRDFRKVTTFTIDPFNAKDFDDALSIQHLDNGDIEIGVHIADVSHYLEEGTAMDKDAYQRSTSVYLVDRVLPMLPEKISNELCSLRPEEIKLTYSAVFKMDSSYRITDKWFGRTVIYSDKRFTYEEAQEVMDTGHGPFVEELREMNTIAKHYRKQRFENGAIDFESEEVQFILDEGGVPVDVFVKERKDAHMLVEEFMLLANKEVSRFMATRSEGEEIPFIYRVHDTPNIEKLSDFAAFAAELGYKMDISTPDKIAESFNLLAKRAKDNENLQVLEPLAIRTMSKAVYSSENIGHYGLAFQYYSHFTSPIRRYSDVIAHRLLEKNLKGIYKADKALLEAQCIHISLQERKAMDAERESIKYKQTEYIEKYVGSVFDGRISGIIDRGIFVEILANKCEGMIPFDRMYEPFHIEESRLKARGLASGKILKMGDRVKVRILDTDLVKRQIEMELLED